MIDYIREKLPHEPACPAGERLLIPFKPDGSFGDPGPCACPRAEALEWLEKMVEFVEKVANDDCDLIDAGWGRAHHSSRCRVCEARRLRAAGG